MEECGAAATHVLGRADKLVAKPFQHRQKVLTQYLNHRPWNHSFTAGYQVNPIGSNSHSCYQQQENGFAWCVLLYLQNGKFKHEF